MSEAPNLSSFSRPERIPASHHDVEREAEEELELLLADPENKFLREIPQNLRAIDDAPTAVEALAFARDRIDERMKRTFRFEAISNIEGIIPLEVSYSGMKSTVDTILKNAQKIGEGGDAFVVVDKNEIRKLPPEICYKFATAEKTPRGRNTVTEEAVIQENFYQTVMNMKEGKIGIPMPFYVLEISDKKIIAMEKLQARSVEHILRGVGHLPAWFDIDEFCNELRKTLEYAHAHGLFHRDMHFGNIMISQSPERAENGKMGYLIDFGLSTVGDESIDPYKKEVAGATFTYDDDYGIIESVNKELTALKARGI